MVLSSKAELSRLLPVHGLRNQHSVSGNFLRTNGWLCAHGEWVGVCRTEQNNTKLDLFMVWLMTTRTTTASILAKNLQGRCCGQTHTRQTAPILGGGSCMKMARLTAILYY
ncbi:hypothetical protein BaRGS_00009106 [Batillaria attramentaria]|uniref:Uncharacterized protein n=1 Tax=Batillaria attramentaria TaxID=370345 RepID=A0ABD0LJY3_9CAEN